MCKCLIYMYILKKYIEKNIEKFKNIEKMHIFDIFENITIFSNAAISTRRRVHSICLVGNTDLFFFERF